MASNVIDRDKGYKAFIRKMKRGDAEGTVGVFGDKANEDHGGITNAQLATIHEFGFPPKNIPEQSFLRSTMDKNRKKYERSLDKIAQGLVSGRIKSARAARAGIGKIISVMRKDVVKTIQGSIPPPVKAATATRKLAAGQPLTPLIATGQLINAIDGKVK